MSAEAMSELDCPVCLSRHVRLEAAGCSADEFECLTCGATWNQARRITANARAIKEADGRRIVRALLRSFGK